MEVQCGDNQVDLSRKIIHCSSPALGPVTLNHKRAYTQIHRPHTCMVHVCARVCERARAEPSGMIPDCFTYTSGGAGGRAKGPVTPTPYPHLLQRGQVACNAAWSKIKSEQN